MDLCSTAAWPRERTRSIPLRPWDPQRGLLAAVHATGARQCTRLRLPRPGATGLPGDVLSEQLQQRRLGVVLRARAPPPQGLGRLPPHRQPDEAPGQHSCQIQLPGRFRPRSRGWLGRLRGHAALSVHQNRPEHAGRILHAGPGGTSPTGSRRSGSSTTQSPSGFPSPVPVQIPSRPSTSRPRGRALQATSPRRSVPARRR